MPTVPTGIVETMLVNRYKKRVLRKINHSEQKLYNCDNASRWLLTGGDSKIRDQEAVCFLNMV